jgi:FkbH-like protein
MTEAVRLVIWDLDETFWHGTVTECGHRYNQATHDIVLELARRGIMSSICSKNDFAPVRRILSDAGIWDSFIFPSIDWSPKGPRIAALIEAVQLRAETIMFIDDNPSNLHEARTLIPGLQIANETFIPEMLASPLFKGKDDSGLTRLAQYKVMERRHADEAVAVSAGGSNADFLRASKIRVRIERDVETHIDRAIELINRTNQLNFTKRRLPEAQEAARAALLTTLGSHMVQAGLLDVSDDYGDYGYCGFYLTRTTANATRLLHFCFSCRILGMGVEAWAYQMLGRPPLPVRGHVLSDPVAADPVDWITIVTESATRGDMVPASGGQRSSVAARGGCVLTPLLHYFAASASQTVGEFNTVRDGVTIRLDTSLCFRLALDGLSDDAMEAAISVGYRRQDFQSRFFDYNGPAPLWIFSNWADLGCPIYRHTQTGTRLPMKPPQSRPNMPPGMQRIADNLAAHFEPAGYLGEAEMKDNLRAVFGRVPAHGRMFVLLVLEDVPVAGEMRKVRKRVLQNAWTTAVAAEFANVHVLSMVDFIQAEHDVKEGSAGGHFDRMVYFRLYQRIAGLAGLDVPASEAA